MDRSVAATFLDTLRRLRLLEPEQLDALERQPPAGPDPAAQARELVRRGWLTVFQVNKLFTNRGDELLLGSYVLLDPLGAGGMGEVFKARNWKLGTIVALKVIRKERLGNPDHVRRFQREVRAAAQLNHPNIVRALDADEVAGTHLFVMEHVDGIDLAKHVKQRGPLPVAEACDHVRQAALGLQHAHERGLVHRDVKPHNLLLSVGRPNSTANGAKAQSIVKVLDLGLARVDALADDESSTSLTATGVVMGTPDYIAPEQAMISHTVDARADVYSLGCTLYFLLTGRPPYPGGTLAQKLMRHQNEAVPSVQARRPDVPPQLAAVLARLMAKRPEDRYQSAGAVAEVLAAGLAGAWPTTPPVLAPAPQADAWDQLQATPALTPSTARRDRRSRPLRLPLAIVALMLAAGLAALGVQKYRATTPQTGANPKSVVVQVAADQLWQDTGIDVEEGATVQLTATGLWYKGTTASSARGLASATRGRAVVADAPMLCLLARIGDEPLPTALAQGVSRLTARRSGRLFLQINDLDLIGNSGQIKVEIEGGTPSDEPAPPPGLARVQRAEHEIERLLAQSQLSNVEFDPLLAALARFPLDYPGVPQARRASLLLGETRMRVPAPLDRLDARNVSDLERAVWGEGDPAKAPAELVAVIGDSRFKPGLPIDDVACSPDGRTVATASVDTVCIWNAATGQLLRAMRGRERRLAGLAFTPDGKTLVAGADQSLRLYDALTGAEIATLTVGAPIYSLAVSPDGKRVAVGTSLSTIVLLDLAERKPIFTCKIDAKTTTYTLDWRPDGKQFASGGDDRHVRLWDGADGKLLWTSEVQSQMIAGVAFRPDGTSLAATIYGRGVVVQWDLATRKSRTICDLTTCWSKVVWSPDGKLLATGDHRVPVLIDSLTGKLVTRLNGDTWSSNRPVFSPDGKRLYTGGSGGILKVWDVPSGKDLFPPSSGGGVAVHFVAVSPDGKWLASIGAESTIRLWDAATGQPGQTFDNGERGERVAFSFDSQLLAATGQLAYPRRWSLTDGKELSPLLGARHADFQMQSLALSPDGKRLASGDAKGKVILWDADTGRSVADFLARDTSGVVELAFSPDGREFAAGCQGGDVKRWSAADGKPIDTHPTGSNAYVVTVAYSPGGERLAAGDHYGAVYLRELHNPKKGWRKLLTNDYIRQVAFRADGKALASMSARELILWDTATGERLREWRLPPTLGMTFAPDGRHILLAHGNNTMSVLRLAATGK